MEHKVLVDDGIVLATRIDRDSDETEEEFDEQTGPETLKLWGPQVDVVVRETDRFQWAAELRDVWLNIKTSKVIKTIAKC